MRKVEPVPRLWQSWGCRLFARVDGREGWEGGGSGGCGRGEGVGGWVGEWVGAWRGGGGARGSGAIAQNHEDLCGQDVQVDKVDDGTRNFAIHLCWAEPSGPVNARAAPLHGVCSAGRRTVLVITKTMPSPVVITNNTCRKQEGKGPGCDE